MNYQKTLSSAVPVNAAFLEVQVKLDFVRLNASGKGFLDRLNAAASRSGRTFQSVNSMSVCVIPNSTGLGTA